MGDSPPHFDYAAYLDSLVHHGHNFIRLYVWEQAAWFPGTSEKITIWPAPYMRTGRQRALDGGPQFDLTRFNPFYFARLRERVRAARARGIYVSVMLFEGWSIELKARKVGNPWRGHPFNRGNNINGIDGDVDGDGEGKEVHTLANAAVTRLQRSYLRKVVDSIGDLENVLWEISNESHPGAVEWQYEMIRALRLIEHERGIRHPIGMTALWPEASAGNTVLFESPADWVSPHTNAVDRYADEPPPASGSKVVIADTDHIWGVGGEPAWVWKSFLRGLNPIFMDPYDTVIRNNLPNWDIEQEGIMSPPDSGAARWEAIRTAMGRARALAERVDLASMRPAGNLASSGFCLAADGKEYLAYLSVHEGRLWRMIYALSAGMVVSHLELDLSGVRGDFDVEWVNLERGTLVAGGRVNGAKRLSFRPPFFASAILHLKVHM